MPKKIDGCLSTSYEMLAGLQSMAKIASAGFNFQNIYGGTPDFRNTSYKNIATYSQTAFNHIDYSLTEISKFLKKS